MLKMGPILMNEGESLSTMKLNPFTAARVALLAILPAVLLACTPALSNPQATAATSGAVLPAIYTSPSASAKWISTETTIAVRYKSNVLAGQIQADLFTINGDQSGPHSGTAILADDQQTIIFKPTAPFLPGESVSVSFAGGRLGSQDESLGTVQFMFQTSSHFRSVAPTDAPQSVLTTTQPAPLGNYVTLNGPVPLISITNYLSTPVSVDSYIFAGVKPYSNTINGYLLILNRSGELVYYQALPAGQDYRNFQKQPNGLLTYSQSFWGPDSGVYEALDSSYHVVRQYQAGNGYLAENHDLVVLPNGHVLLIIYDRQTIDMTSVGGKPDASFVDCLAQELDGSGNVVFEWRASEHVPYTESYANMKGSEVDPYHLNSIQAFPDGNLLLSFRHLSQLIKVDRQTGNILWQMGGKHNQFKFVNDSLGGFSYQHDAELLPNGRLSIFDNGEQRDPQVSRAVEYQLDETDRVVTLTWQYTHQPGIFAVNMGSTDRLADGNTFIGWGGPTPIASEVTADGRLVRDIEIVSPGLQVYRWKVDSWKGNPDTLPTLVVKTAGVTTTLYYSWNGATEVGSYRIEAGVTLDRFSPLVTQVKQGFETSTALSGNASACYYRVMAVDKTGRDMRYSNSVKLSTPNCN
jgi:hypothetical protein